MSAYVRSFRSCPVVFAWIMPVLYVWFAWPLLDEGWPGVWQLGPVMALFTYGMFVCFFNRVRVVVNSRGVWVRKGPFPVTPQPPPVLREQIGCVYVRKVVERVKGSTIEYLAAGVQRTDGACLDLTDEMIPEDAVRQQAAAIAAALDWKQPVTELTAHCENLESSGLIAYLGWAGMLMLSLVWIGIAGALQLGGK